MVNEFETDINISCFVTGYGNCGGREAIEPQKIHGGVFWAARFEALNTISVSMHHRSPKTNHYESIIRIDSPRFADRV